jgi:hypothetical protein
MWDWARRSMLFGLWLVLILDIGCGASPSGGSDDATGGHSPQVDYLNKRLIEVFGPLRAIASTPFLGLAVLTGTALLIEEPVVANLNLRLVQQIR